MLLILIGHGIFDNNLNKIQIVQESIIGEPHT